MQMPTIIVIIVIFVENGFEHVMHHNASLETGYDIPNEYHNYIPNEYHLDIPNEYHYDIPTEYNTALVTPLSQKQNCF